MTLRDFLFLAFGIVVGAVIVVLITGQEIELDPDTIVIPDLCSDENRYTDSDQEGYTIIGTDQRNILIDNFQSCNTPSSPVIATKHDVYPYGFISKKALDKIFCNDLNANGVKCYIGLEGDNVKLMISGGKCVDVNGPDIPIGADATVLVTSYCPTMCDPY